MPVAVLYNNVRKSFPDITEKADAIHMQLWDTVDSDSAYSWFESLAKALNSEMAREEPENTYSQLVEYLAKEYERGDREVQDCIDVAFVENLFWDVMPNKLEPFWRKFPETLKNLYVAFYKATPLERNR